jgi:hypothetical protein
MVSVKRPQAVDEVETVCATAQIYAPKQSPARPVDLLVKYDN